MRRWLNGKEGKTYGLRNRDYRDTKVAGSTDGRRSTQMNPARRRDQGKGRKLTDPARN